MIAKTTRNTLLAAALLVAATSSAQAGPLVCALTATGGAVVALASLFTGPGIFVTGPTIAAYTALACVAPTP